MRHHFPESLQPIEYAQQIIDFRNLLMHRYLDIDDTVVWGIVHGSLGTLQKDIDQLAADFDQSDPN